MFGLIMKEASRCFQTSHVSLFTPFVLLPLCAQNLSMHWFPSGTFYFHTTEAKQPKTTMSRDPDSSLSSSALEEK
jgi:hypothetical protein